MEIAITIPLTKGKVALVDAADYVFLSQHKWLTNNHGYAVRSVWDGSKRKQIPMHGVLLPTTVGFQVDHINGNRLDNRRSNLRVATRMQNTHNQKCHKDNASGFKGVSFNKGAGKYTAKIQALGKRIHMGYFNNKEDAARAYDRAALELHGEFARLNFRDAS